MEKKSNQSKKRLQLFRETFPEKAITALIELEKEMGQPLYLVGGTVRDLVLGLPPKDIDVALATGASKAANSLVQLLGGGTVVPLGRQEDVAYRVVWKGVSIDFTDFRKGTKNIEEDLALRDFTINSMACRLLDFVDKDRQQEIIDPRGGMVDVAVGMLRAHPRSFEDDPLRLLRCYRFRATLGFELDKDLLQLVREQKAKIETVAPERVNYELNCIIDSNDVYLVFREMAEIGLLFHILPEMKEGVGMEQPESHHLDVFDHCLESLRWMEKILDFPQTFFPRCGEILKEYLGDRKTRLNLKWAAFMHDLGKPAVYDVCEDINNRITFYSHDQTGKYLFMDIASRLRWSANDSQQVACLIEMHMHPFHLCTIQRREKVSKNAILKLCKKAGPHLSGLFLLAMADSLACQGEKAPESMGYELGELFCTLQETIDHIIQPVLSGPNLLGGNDLIEKFRLVPGPVFSNILEALEIAQVEGLVTDRKGAIEWVGNYLKTIDSKGES